MFDFDTIRYLTTYRIYAAHSNADKVVFTVHYPENKKSMRIVCELHIQTHTYYTYIPCGRYDFDEGKRIKYFFAKKMAEKRTIVKILIRKLSRKRFFGIFHAETFIPCLWYSVVIRKSYQTAFAKEVRGRGVIMAGAAVLNGRRARSSRG